MFRKGRETIPVQTQVRHTAPHPFLYLAPPITSTIPGDTFGPGAPWVYLAHILGQTPLLGCARKEQSKEVPFQLPGMTSTPVGARGVVCLKTALLALPSSRCKSEPALPRGCTQLPNRAPRGTRDIQVTRITDSATWPPAGVQTPVPPGTTELPRTAVCYQAWR